MKPAQVFAAVNTASSYKSTTAKPKTILPIEERKMSLICEETTHRHKDIQITSTAELSLPPDVCRFVVTVSSKKELVHDVKNSVSRRLDYVLQTLRNYQIRDSDFKVSQSLLRIDGQFQLDADVTVHLYDFSKFQPVCNLFVEKLDDHVRLTGPEFFHSTGKMESLRTRASVLALKNSKQKAVELARVANVKVGKVLSIREESVGESEGIPVAADQPSSHPLTLENAIKEATLHVLAKLTVTFELLPKRKMTELKAS